MANLPWVIIRSSILQIYPRNALQSFKDGPEMSSMSSLVRNEFEACSWAGSGEVSRLLLRLMQDSLP
jgi:hypothetical protein